MIGSAKITYSNDDVCQLVRKDLVDKFGNRELANYNLYLPGVIIPKAAVKQLPNPEVKITSVEDQIRELGVLPKPSVSRGADSVIAKPLNAEAIISNFDVSTKKLVVTGGPVQFTSQDSVMAHWYLIFVQFPVGLYFEQGTIISYNQNGVPKAYVLTETDISKNGLTFMVDAKYTTMNLRINWDESYEVEQIMTVCNASLEEKAIVKIPEFPTEPKCEFTYQSEYSLESVVQVDVDLDCGIR